jgi:hypothetical protein
LAARRAGMQGVILPRANQKDLRDAPASSAQQSPALPTACELRKKSHSLTKARRQPQRPFPSHPRKLLFGGAGFSLPRGFSPANF